MNGRRMPVILSGMRANRMIGLGVAALVGAASLSGCAKKITDDDIKFVRVDEVHSLLQTARERPDVLLLIDPRSPRAYNEGHIPGAFNISLATINPESKRNPAYEGFKNIIIYGDDPASAPARAMSKKMMLAGYKKVRMFVGGMRDWTPIHEVNIGTDP